MNTEIATKHTCNMIRKINSYMHMKMVKTKFDTDTIGDSLIFRIGSLNHTSLSQCSRPSV